MWNWYRYQIFSSSFISMYIHRKKNKKSMSISALANKMMTTTCMALFNLCFYILREYGICGMYHEHTSRFFLFCKLHIFSSNFSHFSIFSFQYKCVCSVCSFSNGHTFSLSLHIISPFSIQIRMLHFLYKIQFTWIFAHKYLSRKTDMAKKNVSYVFKILLL